MDNKVDVVIGGEIISLKSTEQADYMQRLARYVDQKISEIKAKSVNAAIDERVRALLIALNIADDFCKNVDKYQRLDAVHKKFVAEMGRMQEENTRLSTNLREVQEELYRTKAELDEIMKKLDEEAPSDPDNVIPLPNSKPKTTRKAAR